MKPHLILAALEEALRPEPVHTRYDRGIDWARRAARQALEAAHFNPTARDALAVADKALRAWLGEGPDSDSEDYDMGCEHGQEQIRLILDGDYSEITDLLDDAKRRAAVNLREAVNE